MALDIGEKRIGVAISDIHVRLPRPLTTLINDEKLWENLNKLIRENGISLIIVGLPRNLEGDDTKQTNYVRSFAKDLKQRTELPIRFQDEALTSVKAEEELDKSKKPHTKSDVDALAATYVLEDFLNSSIESRPYV